MKAPAAFRATYSDWKLVRTRKVVQIVFEVPIEAADAAYQVVGGMPDSGSETWFGIARLTNEGAKASQQQGQPAVQERPNAEPSEAAGEETADTDGPVKRSWHEMKPAQQAGVLCNDPMFHKFLNEGIRLEGGPHGVRRAWSKRVTEVRDAAEAVRHLCAVNSRADIGKTNSSGEFWREIVSLYRAWVREPEFVG